MKKVELPDFDDMIKLAKEIGSKKTRIMLLEAGLDALLAEITQTTTTDEKYFVGGKPPSVAFIKENYHVLGLNDEHKATIINLKFDIANLTGELKADENLFKVYQEIINVWRTQSANERGAYLE